MGVQAAHTGGLHVGCTCEGKAHRKGTKEELSRENIQGRHTGGETQRGLHRGWTQGACTERASTGGRVAQEQDTGDHTSTIHKGRGGT